MATISSGEQLQQHLIALTVGTPVKDADRQCLHRQKFRIPRHQALLDELADYVAGGSRTGGASSTSRFGCRMPISANALQVQESIRSVVMGSFPGAPLKNQVSAWIRNHSHQELQDEALQGFCPNCGEQEVTKTSCDELTSIRRSALYYTAERASCRSCSATWEGLEGMQALALLLHSQD